MSLHESIFKEIPHIWLVVRENVSMIVDLRIKTYCHPHLWKLLTFGSLDWYIILNYNEHRLRVRSYLPSQFESANKAYTGIEKNRKANVIDAVLVRASSFKELKNAYPNYFTDIGEFYELVEGYLGRK